MALRLHGFRTNAPVTCDVERMISRSWERKMYITLKNSAKVTGTKWKYEKYQRKMKGFIAASYLLKAGVLKFCCFHF